MISFLLLLTAALAGSCLLAVWPPSRQASSGPDGDSRLLGSASPAGQAENVEGVLVTELISGEISRRQYLRAIERPRGPRRRASSLGCPAGA
jgi:hypothetical protein